MLDILAITFPIFAAIAIGYGVVRRGVLAPADMQVLGKFAVNIALPALMFHAVASRDLSEITQFSYASFYALSGLATITVVVIWLRLVNAPAHVQAVAPLGAACPNSTFVGFPIMLLAFPDIATLVLTVNVLVEMILLIPLSLILMDLLHGKTAVTSNRLASVAVSILKMPPMVGLLAGLLVSALGITMPGPLDRLFSMLAGSLAAVALVMIGGSIAGRSLKGELGYAAQISIAKTVLHPALAALIVLLAAGVGTTSLDPAMQSALILSAGMPVIGVYPVFAQRAGGQGVAAAVVFATTLAAFVTVNALLWLTT